MRLLHKHIATLRRHDDTGQYDEDGRWTDGVITESEISCTVQPSFRGSMSEVVLPEGIHQSDTRAIHTRTELETGNEKTNVNADYIIFENKEYETYKVMKWDAPDNLSHWEGLLILRDKL